MAEYLPSELSSQDESSALIEPTESFSSALVWAH